MTVILALLVLLLGSAAMAGPIPIRSGEHDDFTRLVIGIGVGSGWELEATDTGYALTLSDPEAQFQTAGVFDRIPRSRLAAISDMGRGRLDLSLACDPCHADAFLWQPGRIVLDIVDGPGATPETEDQANTASPAILPLFTPPERAEPHPLLMPEGAVQTAPEITSAEEQPTLVDETDLAHSLSRAVSQGLLTPSTPITIETPDEHPETEPILARNAQPESIPDFPAEIPAEPGIFIGSALDRRLAALREPLEGTTKNPCLTPENFDVAGWADDRPFVEQIAELRDGLAGEFDRPSHDAALRLARGYVHFGFGAEALLTLDVVDARSLDRAILEELARVVDGIDTPGPILVSQAGCDNGADPWVMIAAAPDVSDINPQVTLRHFRLLPQPLQAMLAPRLAQAFLDHELLEAAELALFSLDGQDAARTAEATAIRAALAETLGEADVALDLLSEQASDHARTSPRSVIRLIDLAIEQGQLPSEEDTLLAGSLRVEFRNTEFALPLAIAEIRALGARGEYDAAFALLNEVETDLSPDRLADLTSEVTRRLAAAADDMDFLQFIFLNPPEPLLPDVENAIAARLNGLGFPDRAKAFLTGAATREAMAERRYLRAEVFLALDDPAAALAELQGLADSRAEGLRAAALTALGDHDAALTSTPRDAGGEAPALPAFRAGAWDMLSLSPDAALRDMAAEVLSPAPDRPATSLADRRSAVEASRLTRSRIDAFLNSVPAPDVPLPATN